VLPTERIAHLSYGRRLLRCDISVRPMTALGRPRSFGDVDSMSALPPESGRRSAFCDVAQVPARDIVQREMGVRSYLLAEMVEADHASRGLPSWDVFRAKSSTVVSILLRVGSSALVSPATTVGEISVMKLQYS
jgi:hypothetical protein